MGSIVKYTKIKCNNLPICKCPAIDECRSIVRTYPNLKLKGRLLVRHEATDRDKYNYYIVFDSYDAFANYLESIPIGDRCFHEIINGDMPQKIKIDLDIEDMAHPYSIIACNEIADAARTIFYNIFYASICEYCLSKSLPISLDIIQTCITYSIGSTTTETKSGNQESVLATKYGYHICIKDFMIKSCDESREFTIRLVDALPIEYRKHSVYSKLIDIQVNKSLQNLRLIGCHKPNQPNRIKKLLHPDQDKPIDAVITQGGIAIFSSYIKPIPKPLTITGANYDSKTSESLGRIIKKCNAMLSVDEYNHNQFDKTATINGKLRVYYRRSGSSYCGICQRNHDSDNTIIFILKGSSIWKCCRRSSIIAKNISKNNQ